MSNAKRGVKRKRVVKTEVRAALGAGAGSFSWGFGFLRSHDLHQILG
jgi:hypothetical protein